MFTQQRRHPRVAPSPTLVASFSLQGQRIQEVEIVSIGLGGLGGWLDERQAGLFEPHGRLTEFSLGHPDFPAPAPDLRLVFSTLKGQSAQPGRMMFGAEFMSPSEAFLARMKAFLALISQG
jgi:hypothetical protein